MNQSAHSGDSAFRISDEAVFGDGDGAMTIRDWRAADRLAMADDRVGGDSKTLDGDIVVRKN